MSIDRVVVAVVQARLGGNSKENVEKVEALTRQAAADGAGIVVLPELFETRYFCSERSDAHFALAHPAEGHPTIERFVRLAREFEIVVPISFFERDGDCYFNSVAFVDADGSVAGLYRKSHIPSGVGYEEKYYFEPGNTGFKVWETRYASVGVGICWDQWFPEAARAMTLTGADLLVYPSAIGSEPDNQDVDTKSPWRRVMTGHAVSNSVAVAAANRVGDEGIVTFYGSSFIVDPRGETLAEMDRESEGVAAAVIEPGRIREYRRWFGLFGDRRVDLYRTVVGELRPVGDLGGAVDSKDSETGE